MPARYSTVGENQTGLWDTSEMGAGNWAIFYVEVKDVHAAIDHAQQLGATVVVPPIEILAFDAGCGTCTDVIDRISAPVSGRLTVAGLGEDRVRTLRHRAMGADAPFVPTLLEIDGDKVRG